MAEHGEWAGPGSFSYAYQWERCDENGENCTDIAGETSNEYYPYTPDIGHTLRVAVTATNEKGSTTVLSAPTAAATYGPPLGEGPPITEGYPVATGTLTVNIYNEDLETAPARAWMSYQWERCNAGGSACVEISGATEPTYVATESDVGHTLRPIVTFTNAYGSDLETGTASSVITAAGPPVNVALPTLTSTDAGDYSNDPQPGAIVVATAGQWYGSAPIAYTYQWQSCTYEEVCTDITGATQPSYVVSETSPPALLRVEVSATNADGSATVTVTTGIGGIGPYMNASQVVSISGAPEEGQLLTVDPGRWTAVASGYTYQWRRCTTPTSCTSISGATGQTYIAGHDDLFHTLEVVVTATSLVGSASTTSLPTAAIQLGTPVNTAPPAITGEANVGNTLHATEGEWRAVEYGHGYQWQHCNSSGASCSDIEGATASSYTPGSGLAGSTLRVVVTGRGASEATATSAATAILATPEAPVNSAVPTISGEARDGEPLTGGHGSWTGAANIIYSYQWKRCNTSGGSCSPITGATESDYSQSTADIGSTLRLTVTAGNGGGQTTATSAATAVVATPYGPTNIVAPSFPFLETGTYGQPITIQQGSWTGDPTLSEQWQRCDPLDLEGGEPTCVNITGGPNRHIRRRLRMSASIFAWRRPRPTKPAARRSTRP